MCQDFFSEEKPLFVDSRNRPLNLHSLACRLWEVRQYVYPVKLLEKKILTETSVERPNSQG